MLAHTSASFNLGQSYVTQPSHSFGQQPGSASETAFRGRVSAMDVLVRRNPGLISTKHGRRLVPGCASQVSRYSGSYKLINIHIVIQHSVWRQTCICFAKKNTDDLLCGCPSMRPHYALHLCICRSVCPSVACLTLTQERKLDVNVVVQAKCNARSKGQRSVK